MSYTIPEAFRKEFADNFRDVVQQKDSRLMKTVAVERGLTGTGKQIQFVLPTRSTETTGQRFRKTVINELDVDGRWYFPREFDTTTGESRFDEKKLAPTIMGNGKHITAHMRAYHLDCDEMIMNAIVGPAFTGKNGTTVTELAAANTIAVDYTGPGVTTADTGLNASKLIEAIRILSAFEAWNEDVANAGERLWCVVDAKEMARLRHEANKASGDRLYSNDFGGPPEYDDRGFLARWGAVNFVMYNGLVLDTVVGKAGTDTVAAKIVPLYVSSAAEFGVWSDIVSTVDRRADLSNAVQFLSQYSIGGGREQEKKVVRIDCTVA
jgi:hypothetical protein